MKTNEIKQIPKNISKSKKVIITLIVIALLIIASSRIYFHVFVNNLGLKNDNTILAISDIILGDNNQIASEIYIEYQKQKDDYYIVYDNNGYQAGLYNISGQLQGFYALGTQFGKYLLSDDDISTSIMAEDMKKIKDMISIKAVLFYPKIIAKSEETGESIYKIKNKNYLYFFYLDENNKCTRLQIYDINSSTQEKELFQIKLLTNDTEIIAFPPELNDSEFITITGKDFSEASQTFIVSSLAAVTSEKYVKDNYMTKTEE